MLLVFLLGGLSQSWLILSLKKPFAKLALSSVALLDTLLIKDNQDDFIGLLEKKMKSSFWDLLVFLVLTLVSIIPTIFLLYYPFETSNSQPIWFYLLGSIIPFVWISYFAKKQSDYSFLSQLIHRLVLNHYHLGHWLLKRQVRKIPTDQRSVQKSLIITGLARSGTTALTKTLHKNGDFSSLDYSNMPFLLYPRLWKYFYNPKNKEVKERAHKDGINVGLSSVEALEEYYFKVTSHDSYISSKGLHVYNLDSNAWSDYFRYQKSISHGKTYLAKNNNQILRLKSFTSENTNSFIFILFREPLEHANSLLQQHKLFCSEQNKDPFILEYMNWLGHHEFGLNAKPFILNEKSHSSIYNKENIEYWLERWVDYYSYASQLNKVNFIPYEYFLASPKNTLKAISVITKESINLDDLENFNKSKKQIDCRDAALQEKATTIYSDLMIKSKESFKVLED
jgi:hypothetical protein